ncbi:hypothetical protein TNCT_587521 [Trichonephila clavata]|uniref:Uncharacterized protein n=1 Tax=Trichonephila clavata TaxID=2740835 RepID=A0A8X6H1C3_TRICU|nr:hypothetical protein TNCT_587521 [Trichonephila clavata]
MDNRGPFQDNNAVLNPLDTMELVFQQCLCSLYSTIQCLQPVHAAEQKMHPSTQQNSGLKLSMNILRSDKQHRLPYTRRSLRPLVGVRIALGNNTERKTTKDCFKPVNGPPKTFQDAMDPITKQGNCPRTLIRKSPYTKALLGLRIRVPDDIRGQPFGAIPATVPFIIQQSCVFNLSLDNR